MRDIREGKARKAIERPTAVNGGGLQEGSATSEIIRVTDREEEDRFSHGPSIGAMGDFRGRSPGNME